MLGSPRLHRQGFGGIVSTEHRVFNNKSIMSHCPQYSNPGAVAGGLDLEPLPEAWDLGEPLPEAWDLGRTR